MRTSRCTIDSSCIIALDYLNRIPQLTFLFARVLVPKAVREELFKRRITKDRLQAIFDEYPFFERCDRYDKVAIDIFLAERLDPSGSDRGEVEAVVQAAEFGATVVMDDPWGRALAERDALDCHGTLWILERFYRLELITSSELKQDFTVLQNRGIRLPWQAVNALLMEAGEEPLPT